MSLVFSGCKVSPYRWKRFGSTSITRRASLSELKEVVPKSWTIC